MRLLINVCFCLKRWLKMMVERVRRVVAFRTSRQQDLEDALRRE